MVRTEDAIIARYSHGGKHFEILVDADLALGLKNGKEVSFNDLLAIDTIFKDARKGDEASPETIKDVFGTEDVNAVSRKIILEGEVQLTTDQKRKMMENKKKEIIAMISREAINPQTKGPHPPARIEHAMEEAKIHIDLHKSTSEQMQEIVKKISGLIPISIEKLRLAIKVPAAHSGKATVVVHRYTVQKEEWQPDGSYIAVIEIPGGLKGEVFSQLNGATHGNVETKLVGEGN